MHEVMHVLWLWRQGEVVKFLFAESRRETAGNFIAPLREGFDLLMVSSVFRVQNCNNLPCTDSVDDRFSKSQLAVWDMTDVYRTVYN